MAQQRIMQLIEMPGHTSENPYLNESHIARHNLIDAKGLSPTAEELKAEETRLLEEYEANTYVVKRQYAYPSWGSQLEKIYDDGIDKWKTEMVDPVKAKWPKDNSGPVE